MCGESFPQAWPNSVLAWEEKYNKISDFQGVWIKKREIAVFF
jgi:hypothetical protein